MKRLGLKSLWKAVTVGQTAGGAEAAEVTGEGQSGPAHGRVDSADPGLNAIAQRSLPVPPQRHLDASDGVSDGEKTGATLLFSGIFLGLVGMTFTAMGWVNYDQSRTLEWTQFLGPVLLSVGATFVLISVCKFRMLSCVSSGQLGGRSGSAAAGAEAGELVQGHPFVFTGINQPITVHRATLVQYIPPPYASVTQETGILGGQPRSAPASGPPQYYSVCPLESPALGGSASSAPAAPSSCQENRKPAERSEEEEEKSSGEEALDGVSPPAYEDLYPSPSTHNAT